MDEVDCEALQLSDKMMIPSKRIVSQRDLYHRSTARFLLIQGHLLSGPVKTRGPLLLQLLQEIEVYASR